MATGRIGTTPVLQVRWSKAPTANTTSLTGVDDNSVTLTYSVGYEAVYRNGVLLSRGNDYTATNGTTVTLIDATITGDIIEIFANQTVPLSDTFSQTVADGRFIKNTLTTTTGDIIYASGANTPARLGIGSSAQVLTVSGGIPAWATPAGSWTLDSTTTLSGASTSINLSAGYKAFHIWCINYQFTSDAYGYIRFNSNTGSVYRWYGLSLTGTTANAAYYANTDTAFFLSNAQPAESGNQNNHFYMQLYNMDSTTAHKQFLISDKSLSSGNEKRIANAGGFFESTTAITTIQIFTNDTWSGGTVLVYGVK
jgi:hypothetical protein